MSEDKAAPPQEATSNLYRIKIEPVEARQWHPGKHVEGVQEIAHDPGDGSTVSNGYGMLREHKVLPGDWIVNGTHVVHPDEFKAAYEPLEPHSPAESKLPTRITIKFPAGTADILFKKEETDIAARYASNGLPGYEVSVPINWRSPAGGDPEVDRLREALKKVHNELWVDYALERNGHVDIDRFNARPIVRIIANALGRDTPHRS